jgi:hypothetical protein
VGNFNCRQWGILFVVLQLGELISLVVVWTKTGPERNPRTKEVSENSPAGGYSEFHSNHRSLYIIRSEKTDSFKKSENTLLLVKGEKSNPPNFDEVRWVTKPS